MRRHLHTEITHNVFIDVLVRAARWICGEQGGPDHGEDGCVRGVLSRAVCESVRFFTLTLAGSLGKLKNLLGGRLSTPREQTLFGHPETTHFTMATCARVRRGSPSHQRSARQVKPTWKLLFTREKKNPTTVRFVYVAFHVFFSQTGSKHLF